MTGFEQLVIQRLDKIIKLLEKEIEEPPMTFRIIPPSGSITGEICNCHLHKSGELSGGWYCPVHGQCFWQEGEGI